ncbi:MAG: hypothetical protein ACYCZC_03710 [Acidithiobacillus sp.]
MNLKTAVGSGVLPRLRTKPLLFLAKSRTRQANCPNPQGEFSTASGMSHRTTGAGRRSKKTRCQLPDLG